MPLYPRSLFSRRALQNRVGKSCAPSVRACACSRNADNIGVMGADAAARERFAHQNEASVLRRVFEVLDTKRDGRIDAEELGEIFRRLGHKARKSEVADMIWEVDEDCDQSISWHEFQALYRRCTDNQAGSEPRGLYDVIQFVAADPGLRGRLSLEDAMQGLYVRYGREQLDAALEQVFGTADLGAGKTLTLSEFLQALHAHQVRQLTAKPAAVTGPKQKARA